MSRSPPPHHSPPLTVLFTSKGPSSTRHFALSCSKRRASNRSGSGSDLAKSSSSPPGERCSDRYVVRLLTHGLPCRCAHQVCNFSDCIKVASDFVSKENVARCFKGAPHFRHRRFPGQFILLTLAHSHRRVPWQYSVGAALAGRRSAAQVAASMGLGKSQLLSHVNRTLRLTFSHLTALVREVRLKPSSSGDGQQRITGR